MAGFDWEPLVNRRRAFRMFMFYKMHNGLVVIHPTLYLTPRQYHTSHKYYIPHSRIDQHAFSFFPSTVRLWNKLPSTTVHAPSLNVFKARVASLYTESFLIAPHTPAQIHTLKKTTLLFCNASYYHISQQLLLY